MATNTMATMAITVEAGTTTIMAGTVSEIVTGIATDTETTAAAEKTIEVATGLGSENVIEVQELEAEIVREGRASTTGTEITLDVNGTGPVVVTGILKMTSITTASAETVSVIMSGTLIVETAASVTMNERAIEEIEIERRMMSHRNLTGAGSMVPSVIEAAISTASMIVICRAASEATTVIVTTVASKTWTMISNVH